VNYTVKVAERVREFVNALPREVRVQVYQRRLVDLPSDLSLLGSTVFPYANKHSFQVVAYDESPQRLRWWFVFIVDQGTTGELHVESVRDANESEPAL
jgi:hypothetical protein